MRGKLAGDVLDIDALQLHAERISSMSPVRVSVNLAGDTPLVSGDFKLAKLQFPAAYTSFMQITLASSLLGDLGSEGSLSGEVSVADNAVTALHILPRDLELHDNKGRLDLSKVNGDVYWAPAGGVEARVSKLSWASGGAYGSVGRRAPSSSSSLTA